MHLPTSDRIHDVRPTDASPCDLDTGLAKRTLRISNRGFAWLGWIALTALLLPGLALALYGGNDTWSRPGWEVWRGPDEGEKVGEGDGERERGVAV